MIIIKLRGGLGNQLFQYGLGRNLALEHKTDLKLDIEWFTDIPDRQFELNNFTSVAKIATPLEIRKLRNSFSKRAKNILKPYNQRTVVKERFFHFDPAILEVGPDVYLDGYWQSAKYFTKSAPLIQKELTVKIDPIGRNRLLLSQIQNTKAVSLHVRRGDYVANSHTNQFHGTCSLEYYRAAVSFIAYKLKQPHFYIFSDDPLWTKKNLKLKYPTTYVTHNSNAPCEDLRLMSHCQHFIIANSTFSWWAAWLGETNNSIIVAPFPKENITTWDYAF